jgi:chaperonin cofactor prefoldin
MSPRSFLNDELKQKVELYEKKIKSLSDEYELRYVSEIKNLNR